jgi:transposase-like protein
LQSAFRMMMQLIFSLSLSRTRWLSFNSLLTAYNEQMANKSRHKRTADEVRQMIESYENGKSLEEVGREFGGISRERVKQIFQKAGFDRRKYTVSETSLICRRAIAVNRQKKLPRAELENLYLTEKRFVKEIALRFDCTPQVVRENIKRYGLRLRSPKENFQMRMKSPRLTNELLRQLYVDENKTANEIAADYDYAPPTIKMRLSRLGIKKMTQK